MTGVYKPTTNHPWLQGEVSSARISLYTALGNVVDDARPTPQCRTYVPRNERHSRPSIPHKVVASFYVNGNIGIRLEDALQNRFTDLEGKDQPAFGDHFDSIKASLWLQWPGYPPHTRQVHIRHARKIPVPISLSKAAHIIAREMDRNVLKRVDYRGTEPEWQLGADSITLKDIYLTRVIRTSKASIEAEFQIEH